MARFPMRVLVTGAFGNVGSSAVEALAEAGHTVRAFGRPSAGHRRAPRGLAGRAEVAWGDIRRPEDVARAVEGQDVVVHLAAILPPLSEEHPDLARAVNVDGTRNVVRAAAARTQPPRVLFSSTFDVFGRKQHLPPPRRVDEPTEATDAYTGHKLEAEVMLRDSRLEWAIFRLSDVPPLAARSPHPIMFRIPLDTRFEVLHTRDAGLAIANAVVHPDTWGQVWLVGGGPTCQVRYRDYLTSMLEALGIGALPEAAFATEPAYPTDWIDTDASQRAFRYQRHTFEEVIADVAAALGWRRRVTPYVRPLVRRAILSMSPYWKEARRAGPPAAS